MAKRTLGIELTDDRIKIVEVGLGRRLKVFNFAVIENRSVEPDRRAEQLNHTLKVQGFEAKEAVIATSGANVEHRLLTLPPLSSRELHFVMQRESQKLATTGGAEMLWSYEILKVEEELGVRNNQVLLVTTERPLVDAAQTFISQARLKLRQVTTISEAVLNLLRHATPRNKDVVSTVVHFAGPFVHILFVQDGVLLLTRQIHFGPDMAPDEHVLRIGSELKRSTLHFRQSFPQLQLDQIIFSGDNDAMGNLATHATEQLGVPGSIARFEENLDTSSFRGNWDEFRFHLPGLTAAFGAVWRETAGTDGINLLPGKTQGRQDAGTNPAKLAKAACASIAGALLVALLLISFQPTGGVIYRFRNRQRPQPTVVTPTPGSAGFLSEPTQRPSVPLETAASENIANAELDRIPKRGPGRNLSFSLEEINKPNAPAPTIVEQRAPPLAPPLALPNYALTGIVSSHYGVWAIVNTHLVQAGDQLGIETVKEIKDRAVVLESDGGARELRMGQIQDNSPEAKQETRP